MKAPTAVCLVFAFFGNSCSINKAAFDPYYYSPTSSSDYWTPPKKMQMRCAALPEGPTLPSDNTPVSLAELLDIALLNNTQTRITWAQARQAAAQYGQSQSSLFPSLNGTYAFERTRVGSYVSSGTAVSTDQSTTVETISGSTVTQTTSQQSNQNGVFVSTYNQWGPQLTLAYTIFDFGQRRATSEAARQALYYADYTHNRTIETVIQTITSDYYAYLYEQQLLEAYHANVKTAQTTLDAATLGLQTGAKDISDVLQAKTQLLQNEMEWVGQKQQVQNSFASLLNDMGVPANLTFSVIPLPTELPKEEHFPPAEELIVAALENRPDYLAAKANLDSQLQNLKAAKRQLWPTIDYNLDFGRTNYTGGFTDKYDYTSAFSLNWPIFSGYYYRNQIKKAEASKEQAEANLQEIELSVIKDITTYRYNVTVSYETLRYAKNYLAAAEEQYRVALEQYKAGTNSILDVVSAQSSLADARARLAGAFQGWFTSLANLTYGIGITNIPTSCEEVNR